MRGSGPNLIYALLVWPISMVFPQEADLAIRGGIVVTVNAQGQVIEDGFVAIRGDRIVAVGKSAELAGKYRAGRTIDARNHIIMPGLVNTHVHAPMSLLRGIADDLSLMEWLRKHIFPAEARNVTPDFVRWGTLLSCLEMIRSGTTTYADMYYFEDEIAAATKSAGMRAVLGETILDLPAPDNRTPAQALAYTENFIKKWKGDPLIVPAVAPHAPYTCSPETLKSAKALADKYDVPLLIHLSESLSEMRQIRLKYGATPPEHLDRLGFLSDRVVAAHCIWLTDSDIERLKARGVGVAHCPESNMKLAEGVAPVLKLLEAGVAVGLGTDGAASNNNLDLFEEMDTAAKLHKLAAQDPTALNAAEVVRLATLGGARALGLDEEIGSLEAGKRADIIIVSLNLPNAAPMYNVYSHLVYAIKGSGVQTSIINGRIVMEDRKVLTLDDRSILAKAQEYREKIRPMLNRR